MKVKAKHWLNVEGTWHSPDEVFEVESVAGIADAVEVIAESEPAVKPKKTEEAEKQAEMPEEKPVQAAVKRRGTRKM